jgi:hypothetical protein
MVPIGAHLLADRVPSDQIASVLKAVDRAVSVAFVDPVELVFDTRRRTRVSCHWGRGAREQ